MPVAVAVAMPRAAVEPAAGLQVVAEAGEVIGALEADWLEAAAAASERAAGGLAAAVVVVEEKEWMGVARAVVRGAVRGPVMVGALIASE